MASGDGNKTSFHTHTNTLFVIVSLILLILGFFGIKTYNDLIANLKAKETPTPSPSVQTVAQLPATKKSPKDGAEMILIPAGEFLMGDDDRSDNPRHKAPLSDYYIYKNLVTVGMYEQFIGDMRRQGRKRLDGTEWRMPDAPTFNPNWSKKDHPIVNVSWEDATAYCDWAGVGLPTEAQWEKAARGTEGRKYPWGDDFDKSKLWCSTAKWADAGGTAPVGSFASGASPYGVLDMAGNVWQWCSDYYDAGFMGSRAASLPNPVNDSVGEKKYRVLRGGSWYANNPDFLRAAYRGWYLPADRNVYGVGFRAVSSGLR